MIKQLLLLVLFPSLFVGCGAPYSTEIPPKRISDTHQSHLKYASEQPTKSEEESVHIAEPNGVLTLGQALALTLMHNPELKAFSLETRAAEARHLQAGLRPNPELGVEVENLGGTGPLRSFDGAESTIQLSQLVELGDKVGKRRRVAGYEKELAELDYQDKKLDLFAESAKAFVWVLKAQEKLRLSNELLKLSEESFAAVEKRVHAGKDSPVEKIRASVAFSNIKISHLETQRNLDYARKQLASFWGQEMPQFEQAAGTLDRIEPLPVSEDLKNELMQTPGYTRLETEIKRSQAVLDLEHAKATGDVTVGAGVRRFNETDDNAFVFGVSIPLPISDRNQGAKQEAFYNLAKSRHEQKASWLKLHNEFNRIYQEFANAYHQAISLKTEVLPAATDLFNAATLAYQEGKTGYLDVLDAQRTFFDAQNDYVESLAAYHQAKTELERLVGHTVNKTESIQQ